MSSEVWCLVGGFVVWCSIVCRSILFPHDSTVVVCKPLKSLFLSKIPIVPSYYTSIIFTQLMGGNREPPVYIRQRVTLYLSVSTILECFIPESNLTLLLLYNIIYIYIYIWCLVKFLYLSNLKPTYLTQQNTTTLIKSRLEQYPAPRYVTP